MDPETIVAICSAAVAVAAAVVAGVQARFAKQQVEVGKRQAELADLAFRTQQKADASSALRNLADALSEVWRYQNSTRDLTAEPFGRAEIEERRRMMRLVDEAFDSAALYETSVPAPLWRAARDGYSIAITGLQNMSESLDERAERQRNLLAERVDLANGLKRWWREPA